MQQLVSFGISGSTWRSRINRSHPFHVHWCLCTLIQPASIVRRLRIHMFSCSVVGSWRAGLNYPWTLTARLLAPARISPTGLVYSASASVSPCHCIVWTTGIGVAPACDFHRVTSSYLHLPPIIIGGRLGLRSLLFCFGPPLQSETITEIARVLVLLCSLCFHYNKSFTVCQAHCAFFLLFFQDFDSNSLFVLS